MAYKFETKSHNMFLFHMLQMKDSLACTKNKANELEYVKNLTLPRFEQLANVVFITYTGARVES